MRRALAICLLTVAAAGCGADEEPAQPRASGAWERLAQAPLGPREGALGLWTGEEALILGGSDAPPCPPNADCIAATEPPLRDGAAFDPSTGRWRSLAPAPVGFSDAQGVVVGATAYVLAPGQRGRPGARRAFLSYDARRDRWEQLPYPPGDADRAIAGASELVVAFSTTDEYGTAPDVVFDPATGEWSELPDDPLPPSFDRTIAWSGEELVLFGKKIVPQPGSAEPALALAAALDLESGKWRRLPDSETLDGYAGQVRWFEVDGRLVNPAPGEIDGGEVNNWGRPYPFGGVLDPRTGEWSDLPRRPAGAESSYGSGLIAGDEAHYFGHRGWLLDAVANEWIAIPPLEGDENVGARTVVAAGTTMVVFGGVRYAGGDARAELLDEAFAWSPPARPRPNP